ncbi:MAG: carotenoid oxygenase family protein [Sandaracinaceae bacterium]|nr:carotenoid oxygenase family protein [Sandaracinaceae bacterium]
MGEVRESERRWAAAFENVPREHGFEPLRVQGTLPPALRGTLYRNGPGLITLLGQRYAHWFDGDGAVSAVRFADGAASGAVRVLETAGLAEERAREKPYFGAYGTKAPGLWNPVRSFRVARGTSKNPANTSVLAWAGRLLALCEIGRPFEVDPADLASLGETDLDGVVEGAFSAHPHFVAQTGYAFNIGTRIGHPRAIDLFALRPDGTAGRLGRVPLALDTMIHDFAATERHLVIFVAPLSLRLLPMMFGLRAFDQSLEWLAGRGTEVIVVPLDAPGSPRRFFVDPFWTWHVGNAFEVGDGTIALDVVRYRDFPSSNEWLSRIVSGSVDADTDGYLARAIVDPKRESVAFTPLRPRTGEFPRVAPRADGRRHGVLYWTEHSSREVGRYGPPDTVARVEPDTGELDAFTFADGHKPSEAVFAPRPGGDGERDGWLITQVYDPGAHATYWAVLDAAHVSDGPIATAHLDHHVPLSFHGAWWPAP